MSTKKRTNTKKMGVDREHKDITCAVRLPKTMYENLIKAAHIEGSSLSDVIRDALIKKMDSIFQAHREKLLEEAKFNAEMKKYGSGMVS